MAQQGQTLPATAPVPASPLPDISHVPRPAPSPGSSGGGPGGGEKQKSTIDKPK